MSDKLEIQYLPINKIIPYEKNNKNHPKSQVDLLAMQIKEHGFDQPIVVDENFIIVKGHCRLLSCKKLKLKEVPCIVRNDLTDAQKKAARIADNKIPEASLVNLDNLKFEMQELKKVEFDVKLTGFDDWSMLNSFANSNEEKEKEEEPIVDAPLPKEKLPEECKLGDVITLGRHQLTCGNSLELLKQIPDNSIDSVITDPPYGLSEHDTDSIIKCLQSWISGEEYKHDKAGFMGKEWDSFVPGPELWKEVLRVLKPGGHILAFAGTRSMDLMSMAIRLAGFELRDNIGFMNGNGAPLMAWTHGQGFPKSLDISKKIDENFGEVREVREKKGFSPTHGGRYQLNNNESLQEKTDLLITAPSSDLAKQYDGFGTALKPAFEPIILARKPISESNIAQNVMKYGTGGLNIDGTRVKSDEMLGRPQSDSQDGVMHMGLKDNEWNDNSTGKGRFPANLILSHHSQCKYIGKKEVGSGEERINDKHESFSPHEGYKGMYVDKIPGQVRQYGKETVDDYICHEDCPIRIMNEQTGIVKSGGGKKGNRLCDGYGGGYGKVDGLFVEETGYASRFFYCAKASPSERGELNNHPTVKPLSLLRYLTRLITPPNGTVLEPFCGSGTTLLACELENFTAISFELDPKHCDIIKYRFNNLKKE